MSEFKYLNVFKGEIDTLQGRWMLENGNLVDIKKDVYFSIKQTGYYAEYKPNYPDTSLNDMMIFWDGNSKYQLGQHIGNEGEWIFTTFSSIKDLQMHFLLIQINMEKNNNLKNKDKTAMQQYAEKHKTDKAVFSDKER